MSTARLVLAFRVNSFTKTNSEKEYFLETFSIIWNLANFDSTLLIDRIFCSRIFFICDLLLFFGKKNMIMCKFLLKIFNRSQNCVINYWPVKWPNCYLIKSIYKPVGYKYKNSNLFISVPGVWSNLREYKKKFFQYGLQVHTST